MPIDWPMDIDEINMSPKLQVIRVSTFAYIDDTKKIGGKKNKKKNTSETNMSSTVGGAGHKYALEVQKW